jgi:hypothetical protein
MKFETVEVADATHVITPAGNIEKIVSKWNLEDATGGMGVVTDKGTKLESSRRYLREKTDGNEKSPA